MGKILILIVIVALAVGGYYMFMGKKSYLTPINQERMTPEETMTPKENMEAIEDLSANTISLNEQNESGEMGIATLSEKDGKVIVKLEMKGALENTPQPAHIHVGSCPDVGAVAFPLTNVVNGISETSLDVSLNDLKDSQPLGINVHKSAAEAKIYVSCGDLAL